MNMCASDVLCTLIQYPGVTTSNKEQGKLPLQMHWDREVPCPRRMAADAD